MMNPDEDHHNQNVHPDFQVKASGTRDTWHQTIGHPLTATKAQELYKQK